MSELKEVPIRSYAHIGDAVYELFIREKTVFAVAKPENLHKLTVSLVNAEFQADLLSKIETCFTEEENEMARRARNTSITTSRRTNYKIHRLSTAFEAVIGYLYLHNKDRLDIVFSTISPIIEEQIQLLV